MSNTVAAHDRDIATLKECTMNLKQTAARIETTVEDIRKDQLRKRVDHK
jgi:tetrahydromethanopterin S-methyltransferase subunit F